MATLEIDRTGAARPANSAGGPAARRRRSSSARRSRSASRSSRTRTPAGQLIRYAGGALILTALLKGRLGRPTARELALLALVAAVGMVGFNLALLGAVEQIGATNTGVIVGASARSCSRSPPPRRSRYLLGCAGLVVAGAAIVNGVDARLTALGARAGRSPPCWPRSASRCSPRR